MSLLLRIPNEVLAQITSHLSAHTVLITLHSIGDSRLCAKLKSGGVTELLLTLTRAPQWTIQVIQSLSGLRSVELAESVSVDAGVAVIECLPSTLQHLVVKSSIWPAIVTHEIDLARPLSKYGTLCPYKPKRLAEAFPTLKTLRLYSECLLSALGEDFTIEFLKGLPPSITNIYLNLPYYLPENVWELLPPHTESLSIPIGSSPLGHLNLDALADLECALPQAPIIVTQYYLAASYVCRTSSFDMLSTAAWNRDPPPPRAYPPSYPSNLTSLAISMYDGPECELPPFPRSLTNLKWHAPTEISHIHEFIRLLPITMKRIDLGQFEIMRLTEIEEEAPQLVFPDIESWSFSGSEPLPDSQYLLIALPNVISFHDLTFYISLEDLSLLSPNIRSLAADLPMDCLDLLDGSYPLVTHLPHLEVLDLLYFTPERTQEYDFHRCLPPSVTSLNLHRTTFLYAIEHLPARITTFYADTRVEDDNTDWNLFRLPGPSTSASIADLPAESSILSQQSETTLQGLSFQLGGQKTYEVKTSIFQGSNGPETRNYLVPAAESDQLTRYCTCNWSSAMSMPLNVTSLEVNQIDWNQRSRFLATPGLSSSLTKLSMRCELPIDWDLGILTSLTHLELWKVDPNAITRCPPSLTLLQMPCFIPPSMLPLPDTLTEVQGLPLSARNSEDLQENLPKLPSKLKRLTLPLISSWPEFELVISALPSLQRLVLNQPLLSATMLVQIRDRMPSTFELVSPVTAIDDLAMLAEKAGYLPGSIILEDQRLTEFAFRTIRKLFANWKIELSSAYLKFNTKSWSEFVPFLSDSITRLDLLKDNIRSDSPLDFQNLPSSLTEFIAPQHHIQPPSNSGLLSFPQNLQTLVINAYQLPQSCLMALPPHLTSLQVSNLSSFSLAFGKSLPPNLSELCLANQSENEVTIDAIRALPSSLLALSLSVTITPQCVEVLPPRLRYLMADVPLPIADLLRERGIGVYDWTWWLSTT